MKKIILTAGILLLLLLSCNSGNSGGEEQILSDDNSLSSLSCSQGVLSPAFSTEVYEYRLDLSYTVSSLSLSADVTDSTAEVIQGTGAIDLSTTSEVFVRVRAENGDIQTYSIEIFIEAIPNPVLSSITLSAGTLSPVFSSDVFSYTAQVANDISSITVSAICPSHTFINSGIGVHSLHSGVNTITIATRSLFNTETQDYSLSITRAPSSDSTISELRVFNSDGSTEYDLDQELSSGLTEYSLSVPVTTTDVYVLFLFSDSGAVENPQNSSSFSFEGINYRRLDLTSIPDESTEVLSFTIDSADESSHSTYNVSVTREPDSTDTGISIVDWLLSDERIIWTVDANELQDNNVLSCTVDGSYDSYRWYIDGILVKEGHPEITIPMDSYLPGTYELLLILELDGQFISGKKIIQVVE